MVYGDNIKYAELTDKQKEAVTAMQSHLRTWSINRELRVVFSTNCAKYVKQDCFPKTTCHSCERVACSDAFGQALRVKPTPLERMKYIPARYCGPLEDLGAKFAGIRGLSELLNDVSFCRSHQHYLHRDQQQTEPTDLYVGAVYPWYHQGEIQ